MLFYTHNDGDDEVPEAIIHNVANGLTYTLSNENERIGGVRRPVVRLAALEHMTSGKRLFIGDAAVAFWRMLLGRVTSHAPQQNPAAFLNKLLGLEAAEEVAEDAIPF